MKTRLLWLPLVLLFASPLSADSLRGEWRGSAMPNGAVVSIGVNEVALIPLPPANRFTKALEIEITIPRSVFPYRSNLGVFVYDNVVQADSGSSGDRVSVEVLPPSGKFYLEAPLVPNAGLKASVDTAVLRLPAYQKSFPLAVVILPIDKEMPPGYETFQFQVKTKIVNENLGALLLLTPSLSAEERKSLSITANGVTQSSSGPLLLQPGPYSIEIARPGSAPLTLMAVVSQGKTTEIPVDLTVEPPSLVIEAPNGTEVLLDGKKIAWKPQTPIAVSLGSHTAQFVVGNTVVSNDFVIDSNGRHKLVLSMTLQLQTE